MPGVDVWIVPIGAAAPSSPGALSEQERIRAGRYRRDADRAAFVAARSAYREILGGYLAVRPSEVVFRRAASGMPRILGTRLRISTSRRGALALLAVSEAPIGVDVEHVQPGVWTPAFAESCFGTRAHGTGTRELFRLWTRREARGKLLGTGIGRNDDADGIVFVDLPVPGEYVATLAISAAESSHASSTTVAVHQHITSVTASSPAAIELAATRPADECAAGAGTAGSTRARSGHAAVPAASTITPAAAAAIR
jgi:4'-phosphopantetheinyl transferase